MSRLRRRVRRPGYGGRGRPGLQDPVSCGLQCHGDPSGQFRHRRRVRSAHRISLRGQRCGGQRGRGGMQDDRRHPRDIRGLGHRIRGPHNLHQGRRLPAGGRGFHQHARFPSHRCDRHEGRQARRRLRQVRRLGGRIRQRIHEVRRRIQVRQGCGGRDQHEQDPCSRTGRDGGPDDLQVRLGRERPGGQGLRGPGVQAVQAHPVERSRPRQRGVARSPGRTYSERSGGSWSRSGPHRS